MKKPIHLSFAISLLAFFVVLFGCSKDKSGIETDSVNIKVNLTLKTGFSLKLDGSSGVTRKTESDFIHRYDPELTIRFISEASGQAKDFVYNQNESENLSISLPYGSYTWQVIPSIESGAPFADFLPLHGESAESISIDQANVELDLTVETDYALVTVDSQQVTSATLSSGENTMSMPIKEGMYYGYVLSGLINVVFEVTDILGNNLSADLGLVETCKHYKYILEVSDVGINILSCDCEVFEVEERFFTSENNCLDLKTFTYNNEVLYGPYVNEKVCYDVSGKNSLNLELFIHDSWDNEFLEIRGKSNQEDIILFKYSFNNHVNFSVPTEGGENWEYISFEDNLPSLGYNCDTDIISRKTIKLTIKIILNSDFNLIEFITNLNGSPNGCTIFEGDESWSFKEFQDGQKLTDVDGNSYAIKSFCDKEWTTEDLKVKSYSDGMPIPQVQDPVTWSNLTTGAWCYYDNDESKGVLYNWYALNGIHDNDPTTPNKSLAPDNWDVPTSNDIGALYNCMLEYHCTASGNSLGNFIGKAMASKELWVEMPETIAHAQCTPGYMPQNNNDSGFNLTPTGIRASNGDFLEYGYKAYMVTKNQYDANDAWIRFVGVGGVYLDGWYATSKRDGFRVRLVKK